MGCVARAAARNAAETPPQHPPSPPATQAVGRHTAASGKAAQPSPSHGGWFGARAHSADASLHGPLQHGKPKLVGWWCESEERAIEGSGTPPLTETFRTNCYHEEDHLVKKKNDLCPKIFGEDENDPLRRLANVANRGVNRD